MCAEFADAEGGKGVLVNIVRGQLMRLDLLAAFSADHFHLRMELYGSAFDACLDLGGTVIVDAYVAETAFALGTASFSFSSLHIKIPKTP